MEFSFRTFNQYLRAIFGCRVQRIALNAGFTCPNRDGTKGTGGCIYCDNESFSPNISNPGAIHEQMAAGIAQARSKAGRFLAYFQSYSNTYAPVDRLKEVYDRALDFADVVGLIVSTRPDCITDEVLSLLQSYAETRLVWIELGVQTSHDRTLKAINRCHVWADSVQAIHDIKSAGIPVAAHVILGLPGESIKEMIQTADKLHEAKIDGVKLHHLHAVKGTPLARMAQDGSWVPMTAFEYIATAVSFLQRMPQDIVLMRLVGSCPDNYLVAPRWPESKSYIENEILNRLRRPQF